MTRDGPPSIWWGLGPLETFLIIPASRWPLCVSSHRLDARNEARPSYRSNFLDLGCHLTRVSSPHLTRDWPQIRFIANWVFIWVQISDSIERSAARTDLYRWRFDKFKSGPRYIGTQHTARASVGTPSPTSSGAGAAPRRNWLGRRRA